jgi:hypothetical protein
VSGGRRFVTVVTGLPRSGTSLAMQMLGAGGMPLLADGVRPADPDNPRGYLEYAPAKRIATDARFVAFAAGGAVKVVAPLLRHVPASQAVRVLFVERPLDEVIASQERMLARAGAAGAGGLPGERLAAIYTAQLAEARAHAAAAPGWRVLAIEHGALLRSPAPLAAAIDAFLGGGLDRAAMARAVEPSLHRQRGAGWTARPRSPIVG